MWENLDAVKDRNEGALSFRKGRLTWRRHFVLRMPLHHDFITDLSLLKKHAIMLEDPLFKDLSLVIMEIGTQPIYEIPIFEEMQSKSHNDGPHGGVSQTIHKTLVHRLSLYCQCLGIAQSPTVELDQSELGAHVSHKLILS